MSKDHNITLSVNSLKQSAFEASRNDRINKGELNYAYAMGWFGSDIEQLLNDLNLSKKQQTILAQYAIKKSK